ncbi:unnamed protein product [Phyllotreta striolata]|uniref:Activating molecule in BECN1-regulated autophagy protein 1 n=1 Tax=Phyllotreta striolata TaxID=444603 RepID=A0A9N9TTI6_PHYSR|nr:unnamed protein product [Phyllotreta striolata]
MSKDDFDLLHQFRREHISNAAQDLFRGLEDRSFGFSKKNAKSRESIELFAEEEFIRKTDYKELRCEMPGMPRSTFLMVFSPDGSRVASTHGNHNIYITDLRTGKNIKTLVGHPRTPWCIAFHPTSDQIIASGCLGGQVRIWDLSGGSEVWTAVHQTVIASLAFHPNDRVLAIATSNCIYFWDWSKPEPFVSAATYNVKEKVRYVAFDTLGHKLITGIANCPTTRWEKVSAPRQEWCASPYRRRITQRLTNNQPTPLPSSSSNNTNYNTTLLIDSLLSFPEREQRISMCYRTLVREYEQLVDRYLQLYRSPTMIDRGTDPMEQDQSFNNSGTQTTEPQPGPSGTSQRKPKPPSEVVLDECLPGTSGTQTSNRASPVEDEPSNEPSTSSQSPSKSAYNLLTPSRIFSVIKKNTLIRGTQTPESRKHKSDDSDEPKEKRFKKSNGAKTKSSKRSTDGRTNSTQTEQSAPTPRIVVPLDSKPEPSDFRVRSTGEREAEAVPGPSGLQRRDSGASRRQESTETEEESSASRRNEVSVDELLTNIKRTAEERVRNRILPIIRSLPATDRPKLYRLFNNMNFHQMYPNLLRKTNRRNLNPADTTSDSSSSDDDDNSNSTSSSFQFDDFAAIRPTGRLNNSGSNACAELERLVTFLTEADTETEAEDNGTDRGAQTSREEAAGGGDSANFQPPSTVVNTTTTTTNSTIYTSNTNAPRRRFFSHRYSAFMPTRVNYIRHRRMPHYWRTSNRYHSRPYGNSTFGVDELFNYSELDNSEDDPPPPPPPDAEHPEHPEPAAAATSETSVNDMYSNIIRELEGSLENVARMRANSRPSETSNILSNFAERLESVLNQSDVLLRNLNFSASSIDILESNTLAGRQNESEPSTSSSRLENPALSPDANNSELLNLGDLFNDNLSNYNAVAADHTYPRNPDDIQHAQHLNENGTPNVATIFLTIMHIRRQARLLRQQVDKIERIDRAMLEIEQLQLIRRMLIELTRYVSSSGTSPASEGGSSRTSGAGLSSVRQMMAGTRISDSSPRESDAEETPVAPATARRDVVDGGGEGTSSSSSSRQRSGGRKTYPPSRMCRLVRQFRRTPVWRFVLRPYANRSDRSSSRYRIASRSTSGGGGATPDAASSSSSTPSSSRDSTPNTINFLTVINANTLSLMTRRLEQLLVEGKSTVCMEGQTRRDNRLPFSNDLGEHVLALRLNGCVLRMNRMLGNSVGSNWIGSYRGDPLSTVTRDGISRYSARHTLSLIIDCMTRHVENNLPIPPGSHMGTVLAMALLLTELALLVVVDSIPSANMANLASESSSLTSRIARIFGQMLATRQSTYSNQLTSNLRYVQSALGQTYRARSTLLPLPNSDNDRRVLLGTIDRCLRIIRDQRRADTNNAAAQQSQSQAQAQAQPQPPPPPPPAPSSSTQDAPESSSSSNVYHPQMTHISQNPYITQNPSPTARNNPEWCSSVFNLISQLSNSIEESTRNSRERARLAGEPVNDASSNNENSEDEEEEPDNYTFGSNLYRSSNINLSPITSEQQESNAASASTSQQSRYRPWNVPSVQVNDVPVTEPTPFQRMNRTRFAERVSALRSSSQIGGLFRPRFLHPLYSSVNPFDADLDDPQREQIYDSDMITTVSPNHRIQCWDASDWSVPNIGSPTRNLVVGECKIHNDASVDIAKDGTILVTLLPSGGYLNVTNRLGVYSLRWDTLGQCLYTTSFEQNAVSVSLSPLSQHLVVGLASRIVTSDRWIMARIFKIHQKEEPGDRLPVIRELEQSRDSRINCIRWLPMSGQGLIYATNTGQLVVLT